ncbi:hypothetical protein QBZ16_003025 [Prototheca wickerhamii]|uniref:RRM domain-containing protein n=1 Tax=Prototheca wickerhamii TaxID=3111 RepID=A0AAD9MHZ8_PROWI|nr:hypothetical protein QBZ16_003025 [Prototheca wickerhamii]
MAHQSTIVSLTGKGTNPKTTLYVGGLEENVTQEILHAAFIPFGEVKDVSIPLDHASGTNRGFGFVDFELPEDAADAIDNMHNGELYGRVLRVNYAQPTKIKGGDKGWASQAVWADADDWYERADAEQQLEQLEEKEAKAAERAALTKAAGLDAMEAAEAGLEQQ